MPARFVTVDRETPLLLPPDLRDWGPADHLAHFILDAVETLETDAFKVNERGTGDAQYPPAMLLGLLCYSYATGVFGSRRIEQSTYDNVAVRLLTGDTHPDHDTLCTFRRENKKLFETSFVRVLELAGELKLARFGQITIAVDGSKVAANASKHAAVSYQRAGEMSAQLELEVQLLVAKAEQADATPLEDGLTIPEEIVRRQERKAALAKARAEIEARAHARYATELAEHENKMEDLEKKPEPEAPPPDASVAEQMRHRLKTAAGRKLYKLRQQTVEPVFGIIKSAMGFRQFLLRGTYKVSTEWTLVCLAYNLRRLHTLNLAKPSAVTAW